MKSFIKILILSILITYSTFTFANSNFPSFPMSFWGTAKLNGEFLPSGTKLEAYCNASLIGEVVMLEDGIYGYNEPAKIKLLVENCTGNILFKYLLSNTSNSSTGRIEVKYSNGFQSGVLVNKNLNFTTTTVVSDGSNNLNETRGGTSIGIKKGDVNGDDKVDKYDFALLMLNWGKTGLNPFDLNTDGKVDKYDFALLMVKWGL